MATNGFGIKTAQRIVHGGRQYSRRILTTLDYPSACSDFGCASCKQKLLLKEYWQ